MRMKGTGSLIMGNGVSAVNYQQLPNQESTLLEEMKSEHASSALLMNRPKPQVPEFSHKALFNYTTYQEQRALGGNPILLQNSVNVKPTSRSISRSHVRTADYPKKQGRSFNIDLG
jgi:hypothetical protein